MSYSESWLDIMRDEIYNLIAGTVNMRSGTAVTLNSSAVAAAPVNPVNRESFEDMLAEETNFTVSHQPRHAKNVDTFQRGLTSTA